MAGDAKDRPATSGCPDPGADPRDAEHYLDAGDLRRDRTALAERVAEERGRMGGRRRQELERGARRHTRPHVDDFGPLCDAGLKARQEIPGPAPDPDRGERGAKQQAAGFRGPWEPSQGFGPCLEVDWGAVGGPGPRREDREDGRGGEGRPGVPEWARGAPQLAEELAWVLAATELLDPPEGLGEEEGRSRPPRHAPCPSVCIDGVPQGVEDFEGR